MTDIRPSDRDVDRAIRSWLHEDRHEDASRVAGAVLDRVEATPQRRATWWPARRTSALNKIVMFAGAAAAVVAVAVVGVNLVPESGSGSGGGAGGTRPSPSPTLAPSASPQPTPARLPDSGPLDAGTYLMSDGASTFRVTIPPGWDTDGSTDLRKHRDQPNEVAFFLFSPDINVWPDACATEDSPPRTGPTTDDLVSALRAQENSDVSEPAEIGIGGRPGLRLEVSIPEGLDVASCTPDFLRIWLAGESGYLAGLGPTGRAPVYIVETPSGRVVFATGSEAEAADADRAELQAIIDSLTFEP
jgi:hypothetical protein